MHQSGVQLILLLRLLVSDQVTPFPSDNGNWKQYSSAINHEVDGTEILDHKNTDEGITKNNSALWETIANLEREGVLWKELRKE